MKFVCERGTWPCLQGLPNHQMYQMLLLEIQGSCQKSLAVVEDAWAATWQSKGLIEYPASNGVGFRHLDWRFSISSYLCFISFCPCFLGEQIWSKHGHHLGMEMKRFLSKTLTMTKPKFATVSDLKFDLLGRYSWCRRKEGMPFVPRVIKHWLQTMPIPSAF